MSDERQGYNWATLDNSDAINFTPNKSYRYCTIQQGNEDTHYNLMEYENLIRQEVYNFESNNGMYDKVCDSVKLINAVYPRAGNYYAFRICCNNFKTGYIKEINFVCTPIKSHANITNKATKILACNYIDNKAFVKAHFELTNTYSEDICGTTLPRRVYTATEGTRDNLVITKEMVDNPNASILFIVLGLNESFNSYPIEKFISNEQLVWKSEYNTPETGKYSLLRTLCLFRPLYDTCTYSYQPTNGGSLIDYIPVMDYTLEIDIVNDHIVSNYNTYHSSKEEASELGLLKYNAPFIPPSLKSTERNVCFKEFRITHNNLTRNNKFNIKNNKITEILIPFNATKTWYDNKFKNYYTNGIDGDSENDDAPRFTPMYLEIALEEPTENTKWYRSDYAVSQNAQRRTDLPSSQTTDENITTLWRWTFNNEPIEYTSNNGIWCRVVNASISQKDKSLNQLCISYYPNAIASTEGLEPVVEESTYGNANSGISFTDSASDVAGFYFIAPNDGVLNNIHLYCNNTANNGRIAWITIEKQGNNSLSRTSSINEATWAPNKEVIYNFDNFILEKNQKYMIFITNTKSTNPRDRVGNNKLKITNNNSNPSDLYRKNNLYGVAYNSINASEMGNNKQVAFLLNMTENKYPSSDYIVASYTTQTVNGANITYTENNETLYIVPPVKVLFDYKLRLDWFECIDNLLENTVSIPNIQVEDKLSIGNWRIYVNEDGNLSIDTKEMANQDKSFIIMLDA